MESLNSHMERLQWRRGKVMELSSQGHSQPEISKILQVGLGTVNRDLSYLRQQSKISIQKYIDEQLPHEYEKCLVGLTAILREAWTTSQQTDESREKIQALSLAKECYSMKLELLTNATVVDDAIRFVSGYEKEHNNNDNQQQYPNKQELQKQHIQQKDSTIIEGDEEKAIDVNRVARNQVF
ncbi:MAG TPA: hypothetical protein VFI70_01470 [Nitrososphaeraceae archaeon]|nr:hypothetical protein [Nitrososphaeraceae archaeon]